MWTEPALKDKAEGILLLCLFIETVTAWWADFSSKIRPLGILLSYMAQENIAAKWIDYALKYRDIERILVTYWCQMTFTPVDQTSSERQRHQSTLLSCWHLVYVIARWGDPARGLLFPCLCLEIITTIWMDSALKDSTIGYSASLPVPWTSQCKLSEPIPEWLIQGLPPCE